MEKEEGKKGNLAEHGKYLLGIIFIAFLVLIPFFLKSYQAGHDTKYHIANISVMTEQIEKNKIPNSILGKIGYNLGYGSRLFYPPLSHTVTAYITYILENFSFTMIDSLKLVHFLALALSGITMYFLSFRFTKSKKIAFFSGVIYMIFPYHLSDIYVRDSLAECFIFIFLPMIFSGIYELLEKNKKKFYLLFTIGYVGGILSHFTLMIYFTILLFIFLLANKKQVLKKDFLTPFTIATIIVLLITSFFLIGMIENRFVGDYVVFEKGEMTKRISKTALYPWEYLNIFPSLQSEIKFYYPVILLAMIFFTFKNYEKIKEYKYSKSFLSFGLVAFFLSTKLFPWKMVPYIFQMIQFPWRFQIFIGLIVSLFAPLSLLKLDIKKVSLVLVLLLLSSYWVINTPKKEVIDIENIWYNGGMGWQKEYLPIDAKKNINYLKKKKQNIDFMKGEGTYQILENEVPNLTFKIEESIPSTIELPRIYYPGYVLIDEKEEKIPIKMSEYGLLQADILESGTYILEYRGSLTKRITKVLSVTTSIVCVSLYITYSKKKSVVHIKNDKTLSLNKRKTV